MTTKVPAHVRITHMGTNVTLIRRPEFARDIARHSRLIESAPNVRYYRNKHGETFRITNA